MAEWWEVARRLVVMTQVASVTKRLRHRFANTGSVAVERTLAGPLSTIREQDIFTVLTSLKPVFNWANVFSPNILRTVRQTMIRFLTDLLVRRTEFGQFDELYFVLNWLVRRCKLRPELTAHAQQTAWSKM